MFALRVFAACNLLVPKAKLRIQGSLVLPVERFDRNGEKRIPFLSGVSAIRGNDGVDEYSYPALVEFLAVEGADTKARAQTERVADWVG